MGREKLELDTSGFNDEIQGFVITDAFYAADERYMSGQTPLLHWVGKDADGKVYDQAGFHPSWPAPNGWVTADSKTLRNPQGKTALRSTSWLGKLVEQVKALVPEPPKGQPDPIGDLDPLTATTWIGLVFDMDTVEFDFGPRVGVKKRLMPTGFVGRQTVTNPGQAAFTVAATPVAATIPQAAPQPEVAAGETIVDKLLAIARSAPNFEAFQQAALMMPGATADPSVLGAIVDRERGIWAQAHR